MWQLIRAHLREIAMFITGLAGFLHETFVVTGQRPFLISACLALMGLPFVMQGDRKLTAKKHDDPDS